MSDATQHMQRVSVRLQLLTFGGADTQTGELVAGYEDLARDAAGNEARYRNVKASRALRAIVNEKATAAKAEHIANADDEVDVACRDYKVAAALLDARNKALLTLRVEFDGWKAMLQRETTADRIHGQVGA